MMDTETVASIYERAKAHERGLYLLPRRRGGPSYPPTETDNQYSACESLVNSGHAHWISGQLKPGIQLTGKPYP